MKNKTLIKTITWLLKFSRIILILSMLIFVVDATSSIFNVSKKFTSLMPYCWFKTENTGEPSQLLKVQSPTPLVITDIIVRFDGEPPKVVIPWMILYKMISFILGLYVLNLLIRVAKSVIENRLFNRQNALYLRHSALAIITGCLLQFAFSIIEMIIFKNKIVLEGFHLNFVLDKYATFGLSMGLILLVIAEVFRVGTELKEESDLIV